MTRSARRVAVALGVAVLAVAAGARAEGDTTGPSVEINPSSVNPGDRIELTVDGFQATWVTISVCGNEARRGSSDCNMTASEGLHLNRDKTPTLAFMPVAEPPAPCPCVIRVSDRLNSEVAIAPIVVVGHPVAPVSQGGSGTAKPRMAVTIHATPQSDGAMSWVRSSLGGPTVYSVTVAVRNDTTVVLDKVQLDAAVGRNAEDFITTIDLDKPGEIKPGQTWRQTVSVRLPAPSWGGLEWRVAASGSGPTVSASEGTRQVPWLLLLLAVFLVVDVCVLLMRWRVRRHIARAERGRRDADGRPDGDGARFPDVVEATVHEDELVGSRS